MSRGLGQIAHLARRAAWNLVPRAITPADTIFVRSHLSGPVADRFFALDSRDQVHSVAVARRVGRTPGVPGELVEVALLHDIGKANARLGVVGRSIATIIEWTPLGASGSSGVSQPVDTLWARIGRYLRYEELGAQDLIGLGYPPDSLAVRWSREHHWPEEKWSIPIEYGWVLVAADH